MYMLYKFYDFLVRRCGVEHFVTTMMGGRANRYDRGPSTANAQAAVGFNR
jgi:hypothetical protein